MFISKKVAWAAGRSGAKCPESVRQSSRRGFPFLLGVFAGIAADRFKVKKLAFNRHLFDE
jgi:hypothetical protein